MRKITTTALTAAFAVALGSAAMAQAMDPTSPSAPEASVGSASTNDTMSPGSSATPSPMRSVATASQVKTKLEASGYSNVQAVRKGVSGWTASATKDGKSVRVAVDQHSNIMTR